MRSVEFEKVAKILANQHKISIQEGSGWSANIKNKIVYYKKNDIYELSEEHVLGLLLHEIAHIKYSTATNLSKEKQPELLHSTMNMLEDITIERLIGKDYPNAGEILETTEKEILDILIGILPNTHISEQEKALHYAAIRFAERGYKGKLKYEIVGEEIANLMKIRQKEIYKRPKTKDLLPLAKDILEIILKEIGEPTPQEKQNMAREAENHTNGNGVEKTGNAKDKAIKKMSGGGWGANEDGIYQKAKYIDKIADQALIVGKRLRSVLKRNNAMEFAGKYKSGKIATKRLAKIRATKDKRPFARRIVKSNQSYAFAIAADTSGSMWSGQITDADCALTSMYMVAEALKMAKVPRSLMVFADTVEIINPINKQTIKWGEIINQEKLDNAGGGTQIERAIDACRKELIKVRAERKIMVILTDGESSEEAMRSAHEKATKVGIECLSITIGNGHGKYMEKIFKEKNRNIGTGNKRAENIGNAFIDILKETITNS